MPMPDPGRIIRPARPWKGAIRRSTSSFFTSRYARFVTNYGTLDILWFDYSSPQIQGESWRANELVAMVRQQQPAIITNNRLYRSAAAGWHDDHHLEPFDNRYGDFCTPEQRIPPTGVPGVGLGNVHDDQHHLGLFETRPRLEINARR